MPGPLQHPCHRPHNRTLAACLISACPVLGRTWRGRVTLLAFRHHCIEACREITQCRHHLRHLGVFSMIAKCLRIRRHFTFNTMISFGHLHLWFTYELCLINWVEIPRKIGNVEINRIPNIRKCLEATKNSEKNRPSTDIPPANWQEQWSPVESAWWTTPERQEWQSLAVREGQGGWPTVVMMTEDITTLNPKNRRA